MKDEKVITIKANKRVLDLVTEFNRIMEEMTIQAKILNDNLLRRRRRSE